MQIITYKYKQHTPPLLHDAYKVNKHHVKLGGCPFINTYIYASSFENRLIALKITAPILIAISATLKVAK